MEVLTKAILKKLFNKILESDDPFDSHKTVPKVGEIRGAGGAEGPTFEVINKLMEEGIDPKDIDFKRVIDGIEKGVLKDGRAVDDVKESIFEAEKNRIGAESTDPSPPPLNPDVPKPSPEKPDPPNDANAPGSSFDAPSDKDGGESGKRLPGPGAQLDDTGDEPDTPETRAFMKDVVAPGAPIDEILLKRAQDLTEGEVREIAKARIDTPGNNERERLAAIEKVFFDDKYGTGPVEFDATGRMVDPKPKKPINRDPIPVIAANGKTLEGSLERIGRKVVAQSKGDGLAAAVRHLQGGLNILDDAGEPENAAASFARLAEDGVFGPKTRSGLRRAVATFGAERIDEGLALGRFNAFARDGRRNGFEQLGRETERAIGPLFRDPSHTTIRKPSQRVETVTLQETLNDLGGENFGPDQFETLKLDGDIGPKTTKAFGRLTAALGPERLTGRFGEMLSFL